MKYGSICSGVEIASLAWQGFGRKASFLAGYQISLQGRIAVVEFCASPAAEKNRPLTYWSTDGSGKTALI